MALPSSCTVLVVGSGNAGFSAAVAARQAGAQDVVLIDRCPESWAGGNSYFTAGAYRTVHGGKSDLLPLVNNVDEQTAEEIDIDPYTEADFYNDLSRMCGGRSDPELARILVQDSTQAIQWLAGNGIRFQLSFNRQAYKVNGRIRFWGGLALKTDGLGKGLVADHAAAAKNHGVSTFFDTPLVGLKQDPRSGAVVSAIVRHQGQTVEIRAGAVILAAGGFESSPSMRAQYLGPGWDCAKVRGTPYNTGDVLNLAIRDAGAATAGNWSGCHSVAWDANAPSHTGDQEITNEFTKSGYPLGLMLNTAGKRFVDEGVDLRNFTYAKFGRAILGQPDRMAFQVWDSRMIPWLRDEEYREERVERITAPSITELASKLVPLGLRDPEEFIRTLDEYNTAVAAFQREHPAAKWDPAIKDGLSTQSSRVKLALPKTNWATPLNQGPFLAVRVTCGVTFTFGGLSVIPETAQVKSRVTGEGIPGLFCVGEMLGGLFYDNYPGGSGLTAGAVFGRRAGREAARVASLQTKNRRLAKI